MTNENEFRCGEIAFVGQPNVGKSTLINRLVGREIGVVTPKPHTTLEPLVGVKTFPHAQLLYVDLPGLALRSARTPRESQHSGGAKTAAAWRWQDADIVALVIRAIEWTTDEDAWIDRLKEQTQTRVLIINQVDRLRDKTELLKFIDGLESRVWFHEIIPISALKRQGLDDLENTLIRYLPQQAARHAAEVVSLQEKDREVAECVREQLLWQLHDELPYKTEVGVDSIKAPQSPHRAWEVDAQIVVAESRHKGIVIGENGQRLKTIGQRARMKLAKRWGAPVILRLVVSVASKIHSERNVSS